MAISSQKMAEKFLRDQIRIMKKHGKGPKLSSAQKEKLVSEIKASFESLRSQNQHQAA
ncbi:MAG TPA: hypothetical protein VHF01_13125 [Candidatus Acidoferrum sp.]|jgi:hypothetical protein|nr:hypothetical protein [Candidatus Acidoferrum sp.]